MIEEQILSNDRVKLLQYQLKETQAQVEMYHRVYTRQKNRIKYLEESIMKHHIELINQDL